MNPEPNFFIWYVNPVGLLLLLAAAGIGFVAGLLWKSEKP